MHAPGKGISQSALPYRRTVPQWMKLTSDEVQDQIFKLAKKGLTPSQIGVILRDSFGVAQVRKNFHSSMVSQMIDIRRIRNGSVTHRGVYSAQDLFFFPATIFFIFPPLVFSHQVGGKWKNI